MRAIQDPVLLRALAAEVRARRTALKINQETLAFDAEVTRSFMARIETGVSSPSLTTLFKIADGLQVDPGQFVSAIRRRYLRELKASNRNAKQA